MAPPRPLLVALAAMLCLAAACTSSGTEASSPQDLSADAPLTTEADTTTTAEVDTTTTSTEASTTTVPAVRAPLTGLPYSGPAADLDRPALLAKIDNDQKARPQVGLAEADLVFEMLVEASITRFGAVFHSDIPDPIGPLRSSRTSDYDLLAGLDTPLYASSGGNSVTMSGLRNVSTVDVTNNRLTSPYFRERSRRGPHNLFVPAPALYEFVTEASERPEPWFEYRDDGDPVENDSREIDEPVTVTFSGRRWVTHAWDQALRGWARTQDGAPHTDILGDQLAPENVVIMVTTYGVSRADASSPELRSIGGGDAYVLTDGRLIEGTWERINAESKPDLRDSDGKPILLTPGRTWVLFPTAGDTTLPA